MDDLKSARRLLAAPLWIALFDIGCFALAYLLAGPTNGRGLYGIISAVGIFGFFLLPLPCLILSLFGTIRAYREHGKRLFALGVVETGIWAVIFTTALHLFLDGLSI